MVVETTKDILKAWKCLRLLCAPRVSISTVAYVRDLEGEPLSPPLTSKFHHWTSSDESLWKFKYPPRLANILVTEAALFPLRTTKKKKKSNQKAESRPVATRAEDPEGGEGEEVRQTLTIFFFEPLRALWLLSPVTESV